MAALAHRPNHQWLAQWLSIFVFWKVNSILLFPQDLLKPTQTCQLHASVPPGVVASCIKDRYPLCDVTDTWPGGWHSSSSSFSTAMEFKKHTGKCTSRTKVWWSSPTAHVQPHTVVPLHYNLFPGWILAIVQFSTFLYARIVFGGNYFLFLMHRKDFANSHWIATHKTCVRFVCEICHTNKNIFQSNKLKIPSKLAYLLFGKAFPKNPVSQKCQSFVSQFSLRLREKAMPFPRLFKGNREMSQICFKSHRLRKPFFFFQSDFVHAKHGHVNKSN